MEMTIKRAYSFIKVNRRLKRKVVKEILIIYLILLA
jgi:hypothetical protein